MQLTRIPAGTFWMGSPADEPARQPDEFRHEVTITRPFYLGVYCVTVGQYARFVRETFYRGDNDGAWQSPGYFQTDDYPVGNVSWNDAVAFCDWLTKKERRRYRLPTEAEWEYACRAGSTTRYFFGDDVSQLPLYAFMVSKQHQPMAQVRPNPWGLYHMYGNQWQWTADWYAADYYQHSPKHDPQGPARGTFRVMRGSSMHMDADASRSAFRHGTHEPTWFKPHAGFRVVMIDDVTE
jgi:formylglycine-generating enzyme required for sulfatase activity